MNNSGAQPSIGAVGALFSATIGFGLKRILDAPAGTEIEPIRWGLFVASVLFFLRFLTGSATHLWFEYVNRRPPWYPRLSLVANLSWLTLFGIIALRMCYTSSLTQYYTIAIVYLGAALLWCSVNQGLRKLGKCPSCGDWGLWILINPVHAALFVIALWLHTTTLEHTIVWGFSTSLLVLCCGSSALLVWDLMMQYAQLSRLHGATPGGQENPPTSAGSSGEHHSTQYGAAVPT